MRVPFIALALALVSCAAAPAQSPSPPVAPPPAAPRDAVRQPVPPRASYVEVFDSLVKRIESTHVFPPAFVKVVGHPWADDVPSLREEIRRASTREDALIAFLHLQNSLRDSHCWLDAPSDAPHRQYSLGLSYWSGGTVTAPDVRVQAVGSPPSALTALP